MSVEGFIHKYVKIQTIIGVVEGVLEYIDYDLSHNGVGKYPKCLILRNGRCLHIIRNWDVVKLLGVT